MDSSHMSTTSREPSGRWPASLNPGALRWAWPSAHYEDTIAFYRDAIGLPVIDQFAASFGEDGTIFGLPDNTVHIEIVRAHGEGDQPTSFGQLVLYLDGDEAVAAATAPLRERGFEPEADADPYWAANRAVTFHDPDGRDVIFAPWVFGRDPQPTDDTQSTGSQQATPIVGWYDADRSSLRPLFEQAEDSPAQIDRYLQAGRVLVARSGANIVGHLQLVSTDHEGEIELKNMAVVPERRGAGFGRELVAAAVSACRNEGTQRIVVATAAADVGNLRFYQRCGFRLTSVEHDAFTPETGYPDPILIDGIPLLDRVWLSQDL